MQGERWEAEGGQTGQYTAGKTGQNVSTPKISETGFRSDRAGTVQIVQAVDKGQCVGGKVEKEVEGKAQKEVVWAMSRWKLSVRWKRCMVAKAVDCISLA